MSVVLRRLGAVISLLSQRAADKCRPPPSLLLYIENLSAMNAHSGARHRGTPFALCLPFLSGQLHDGVTRYRQNLWNRLDEGTILILLQFRQFNFPHSLRNIRIESTFLGFGQLAPGE